MPKFLSLLLAACTCTASYAQNDEEPPPITVVWSKYEDSLCVNDWWNRPEPRKPADRIIDLKVPRDQVIAFGIYTVSGTTLKLSAQCYPLYPQESREVDFEIAEDGAWKKVQTATINDLGWSALIRVEDWPRDRDVKYRLSHAGGSTFEGLIRKDPVEQDEIVLAALSCNSNRDRGLRPEYTRNINHQDPDLVFFAGDQSYDHLQHTAAWLKFGLAFKEIFRTRPCVTIPDDHDIGQGNLWGEGGKKAKRNDGADGGYFYDPGYVQMVERQQTAHLPDPYDPTPVQQEIGVYYTSLNIGGIDFAIIEDRKFKTGPAGRHPMKGPRPDHIRDPEYDPKVVDVPGLKLLGERQLKFLDDWSGRREGTVMKAVLSQTGFCGGAHLHGSRKNRLHADMDSNGWPQTGRNKALRAIKKANAVHIAGDQHLATLVQHGIDDYRDGPWAFVVPALVNTYYGRWWWPTDEQPGGNAPTNSPLPWVGDYEDGFGNKITMHAYANPDPRLEKVMAWEELPEGLDPDKLKWADGYGLIRFKKSTREVTFECWPRFADVTREDARQFPGWPHTISLEK